MTDTEARVIRSMARGIWTDGEIARDTKLCLKEVRAALSTLQEEKRVYPEGKVEESQVYIRGKFFTVRRQGWRLVR